MARNLYSASTYKDACGLCVDDNDKTGCQIRCVRMVDYCESGGYTWTVPTGVTKVTFEAWGAGGGGSARCCCDCYHHGHGGSGGGLAEPQHGVGAVEHAGDVASQAGVVGEDCPVTGLFQEIGGSTCV